VRQQQQYQQQQQKQQHQNGPSIRRRSLLLIGLPLWRHYQFNLGQTSGQLHRHEGRHCRLLRPVQLDAVQLGRPHRVHRDGVEGGRAPHPDGTRVRGCHLSLWRRCSRWTSQSCSHQRRKGKTLGSEIADTILKLSILLKLNMVLCFLPHILKKLNLTNLTSPSSRTLLRANFLSKSLLNQYPI